MLAILPTICYAQFNTIGEIKSKLIMQTIKNPSEQVVVPKDSIQQSDASSVSESDTKKGQEELVNLKLSMSFPLKNIQINSKFGMRMHPIYHKYIMHNGIDLKAKNENVFSMFPGIVTAASYSSGGGYFVTVNYGFCECSFLHLSKIEVQKGQKVIAGQKIAVSGNTGKNTTGPHLHLSCKWSDTGQYFDPKTLLVFIANKLQKYNNAE